MTVLDGPALADQMGRMALVEGSVTRVVQGRSRIYIRLGRPGSDFALSLDRREAFILKDLGFTPDGLIGRSIRARGVLDDRNGPVMDIVGADQVEVLGSPPQAAAP